MIELKLYKNGELDKTCKVAFIPWSLTRFVASFIDGNGEMKKETLAEYQKDPMKFYEDIIIKLFSNQVTSTVFEDYEIEGSEVVRIGKLVLDTAQNKGNEEEKN